MSTAARDSADIGSPCVPLISTKLCLAAGHSPAQDERSTPPARQVSQVCAISVDSIIERPTNATLRPCSNAASIASLMRWIDDENMR